METVDKWICLLRAIRPNHELLIYDSDGKTEEEKEELTILFYMNFSPDGLEYISMSNEVILMSWQSYAAALETAVVIEKARTGYLY
jgi:hypothetical protein